jgi:hypothetical protein
LVVTIGPPGSNDFPALGARRPDHDHVEFLPVADADVAFLAVELAHVLALEHRIVEHARSPDEVDAMVGQVPGAVLVLPLEHLDLYTTAPPQGGVTLEAL